MTFSHKHNPIIFDYKINHQNILTGQNLIKNLGVTFNSHLSFGERKHIKVTVSSAFKMLGFLIRNTTKFTNISIVKALYWSFVRSKLEQGALVFYPHYTNQIRALESVRRTCLKLLYYKVDKIYPPRSCDQSSLIREISVYSFSWSTFVKVDFIFARFVE